MPIRRPSLARPLAGFVAAVVLGASPVGARLLQAQQPAPPAAAPTPPPARPADVQSVDAIIAAVYDVISGDAGQKRDWDRFRSLFHPQARLIPTGKRPQSTEYVARVITPDQYVQGSGAMLERDGFHEVEIARTTEQYGNIVHAFSTYESRRTKADAQPFMRGINSIQLYNDGTRWWVLTIFWQGETPDVPLPAKYLPKGE